MVVAPGMFHKTTSPHIRNVRSTTMNEAIARLPTVETAWAVLRRQNTATMCACLSGHRALGVSRSCICAPVLHLRLWRPCPEDCSWPGARGALEPSRHDQATLKTALFRMSGTIGASGRRVRNPVEEMSPGCGLRPSGSSALMPKPLSHAPHSLTDTPSCQDEVAASHEIRALQCRAGRELLW